jgi:hypothetical protein
MVDLSYFWFLSAAFWIIVIHFARATPTEETWPNRPSDADVTSFRRRLAVAVCGPQVLLGTLDLLSGSRSPLLMSRPNWSNPFVLAAWGITIGSWLLLVWWLWARNGSAHLARFAPALNLPANPWGIRWVLTGLVVLSAVTAFLGLFADG